MRLGESEVVITVEPDVTSDVLMARANIKVGDRVVGCVKAPYIDDAMQTATEALAEIFGPLIRQHKAVEEP